MTSRPETDCQTPIYTDKCGTCLIINVRQPKDNEERLGSDVDVKNVEETFSEIGFAVEFEEDSEAEAIRQLLQTCANRADHKGIFACVIMSHGENGKIIGSDGEPVTLCDILKPFYKSESLRNVPKLFFVQACRDESPQMQSDASKINAAEVQWPKRADFLVSHSTTRNSKAFRHPQTGSVYIEELCKVLKELHATTDLEKMLKEVTKKVVARETEATDRQVPVVEQTLRESVFLGEKPVTEQEQAEATVSTMQMCAQKHVTVLGEGGPVKEATVKTLSCQGVSVREVFAKPGDTEKFNSEVVGGPFWQAFVVAVEQGSSWTELRDLLKSTLGIPVLQFCIFVEIRDDRSPVENESLNRIVVNWQEFEDGNACRKLLNAFNELIAKAQQDGLFRLTKETIQLNREKTIQISKLKSQQKQLNQENEKKKRQFDEYLGDYSEKLNSKSQELREKQREMARLEEKVKKWKDECDALEKVLHSTQNCKETLEKQIETLDEQRRQNELNAQQFEWNFERAKEDVEAKSIECEKLRDIIFRLRENLRMNRKDRKEQFDAAEAYDESMIRIMSEAENESQTAAPCEVPKPQILVIGPKQSGKSIVANKLIGREAFDSDSGMSITTAECKFTESDNVSVIDTPGIDTLEEANQKLLTLSRVPKFNCFLLTFRLQETHEKIKAIFEVFRKVFGDGFDQSVVLAFTSKSIDFNSETKTSLPPDFSSLACRCVLFNLTENSNELAVTQLLDLSRTVQNYDDSGVRQKLEMQQRNLDDQPEQKSISNRETHSELAQSDESS